MALCLGCGPGLVAVNNDGSGSESSDNTDPSQGGSGGTSQTAGTTAEATSSAETEDSGVHPETTGFDATSDGEDATSDGSSTRGTGSTSASGDESTGGAVEPPPPWELDIPVGGRVIDVEIGIDGLFLRTSDGIQKRLLHTGELDPAFAEDGVLVGYDDPTWLYRTADVVVDEGRLFFTSAETEDNSPSLQRYDAQTGVQEFAAPLPDWASGFASIATVGNRVYAMDAQADESGEFVVQVYDADNGAEVATLGTDVDESDLEQTSAPWAHFGAHLAVRGTSLAITLNPAGNMSTPLLRTPSNGLVMVLTMDAITGTVHERLEPTTPMTIWFDPIFSGPDLWWVGDGGVYDSTGAFVVNETDLTIPDSGNFSVHMMAPAEDSVFLSGRMFKTDPEAWGWYTFVVKYSFASGEMDATFGVDGVLEGSGDPATIHTYGDALYLTHSSPGYTRLERRRQSDGGQY